MSYKILEGDCFELIKNQPDNSVDLIITSPPYSDIVNYGKDVSTKKPDDYVDWILPLFNEIYRVLKPSGSFILNINDKCENGLRSTYIYDLISRNNKETKLKLYDTYIWYKRNGIPNGGTRRFRNTTEFIFHFCKDQKKMKFYMDRVMEETNIETKKRFERNGLFKPQGNIIDGVRSYDVERDLVVKDKVRPDNVVRFSTAGAARDNLIKHPAPYHKDLPLYYINLLTDEGDLVIDPFSGIATTGVACRELNREYIGYELNKTYADFSIKRLQGILNDEYVVNQYSLDDEFIKSYPNRSSAGKQNNLCEEDIMRCYRGNRLTVGGFKWKLEKRNNIIGVNN
jgi:site-specific DNA-methyltransferase (adenine-specific)/site-specific DNA-methyltransferase (cytosine-N4-specific)